MYGCVVKGLAQGVTYCCEAGAVATRTVQALLQTDAKFTNAFSEVM